MIVLLQIVINIKIAKTDISFIILYQNTYLYSV